MSVVAIRPLRKGEAVTENYGPLFTHEPLQKRRTKLESRYWFKLVLSLVTVISFAKRYFRKGGLSWSPATGSG